MLILVRKVQQSIWIEGDIYVKVLSVERDRVKLGITAPDDVKVMRQELFGDEADAPPSRRGLPAAEPEHTNGQHRAAS
jgi:carbon storage regulator CsrA